MELANNLENNLLTSSDVTLEDQKGFLDSTLGKVINTGLDAGIRFLLPDLIEEQVIDVKDAIINNGFKAGVEEAISSAVDFGKSVVGIFTGKFESVTQAENAVKQAEQNIKDKRAVVHYQFEHGEYLKDILEKFGVSFDKN